MKRNLAAALAVLLTVSTASAVEKSFTIGFAYQGTPDSFRFYEVTDGGGKRIVADEIPGGDRSATFSADINPDDCHTFFMVAMERGIESLPSNPISWCPEYTLPEKVTRPVRIEGEVIFKIVDGTITMKTVEE